MLYTEKEKNEIERVRKVFEKHIQQMTAYDLVWSDKVGYPQAAGRAGLCAAGSALCVPVAGRL